MPIVTNPMAAAIPAGPERIVTNGFIAFVNRENVLNTIGSSFKTIADTEPHAVAQVNPNYSSARVSNPAEVTTLPRPKSTGPIAAVSPINAKAIF